MRRTATVLILAISLAACDRSAPLPPTPLPTPPVVLANVETGVWVLVDDSAYQPLAGVMVEILDGPQARLSGITDAEGEVRFSSHSVGPVNLRASKDGYTPSTITLNWRAAGDVVIDGITLDPIGPRLTLEPGDYTMTVTTDPACTEIPEPLRTRVYAATVRPLSAHPQTRFSVSVSGSSLPSFGFALGIAGGTVGFTIDGPAFFESLPAFTYLEIAGSAPSDAPATSTGTTMSIPFRGNFQYCVLKSERGRSNNCFTTPLDQKIGEGRCFSSNSRMVLSR